MSGRCIVFGGVFLDDPGNATCSNAAVVIDRQCGLAGVEKGVRSRLALSAPDPFFHGGFADDVVTAESLTYNSACAGALRREL
jgi:hypothetical protein